MLLLGILTIITFILLTAGLLLKDKSDKKLYQEKLKNELFIKEFNIDINSIYSEVLKYSSILKKNGIPCNDKSLYAINNILNKEQILEHLHYLVINIIDDIYSCKNNYHVNSYLKIKYKFGIIKGILLTTELPKMVEVQKTIVSQEIETSKKIEIERI